MDNSKLEGLDKNVPSNAVVIGGGLVRVGGVRRSPVVVDAMDSVNGDNPQTDYPSPESESPSPESGETDAPKSDAGNPVSTGNSGPHNGDTTPNLDDFEV